MTTKAIVRIHVEGFRSLRDVTLEPGRVTVLIGPNGAGKSNLLSFLRMIPLMHTGALRAYVGRQGGASAVLHYGPQRTPGLGFRIDFTQEDTRNSYSAELSYAQDDQLVFVSEEAGHTGAGQREERTTVIDAGHRESSLRRVAKDSGHPTLRTVDWWLGRITFYHFHDTSWTSPLRQNSPGADDRFLRSDGKNLATFLYRLMRSEDAGDKAAWRRINLLTRRVAPSVVELMPEPVNPHDPPDAPTSVSLRWRDDQGQIFGVGDLSDGTLRAIALIAALAQPAATLPLFLSIDEPELGLHPSAISLLVSLIRSVSVRCQVLLATQSPALLDYFQPEEVVVVERRDGATTLRRLVAADLAEWLRDYSLSELLDKNVLEGRP